MLKTVEIPLAGHPDKLCDRIVEAIVDEYLRRDPSARIDLQALGGHGMLMIGGTVDSRADFDCASIVKRVYEKAGYTDDLEPFVNIERPSEETGRSMVHGGAQGTCVVYGYATRETRECMPRAQVYATALARRIDDLRRTDDAFAWMLPDGKVQLTMKGDVPVSVTVLVQHTPKMDVNQMQMALVDAAIVPILGNVEGLKMHVNSGGAFSTGGFGSYAGASGRKLAADTYGGLLPNGGAVMTGKDPLKPARCGALMARYVAKRLVAEGVSGNVLVQAAYTIGQQEPPVLEVRTGNGEDVTDVVKAAYDFRPEAIVERLDLCRPLYESVSAYGTFGRAGVPWEKLND